MRISNVKIEDRILLKRATQEACSDSLGKIYQKYMPFLTKYIGQKVLSNDEGQDLVHAVFLCLCQGNCKYTGQSDVQGYLCGIAKNVLRDHFKAKKRQVGVVSLDEIEVDGDLVIAHSYTEEASENLQKEEIQVILKEAVAILSEKPRQAIKLVYFDGMKIPDAAKMLGCDSKVVRDRLYRAMPLLRAETRTHLKKNDL